MNLDDLKRLFKQCTFGAAKETPCRTCGTVAEFIVPGYGIYCGECLPEGVTPVDFDEYMKTTKLCESRFRVSGKCYNAADRECETCRDSICQDCYYDSPDFGRCEGR